MGTTTMSLAGFNEWTRQNLGRLHKFHTESLVSYCNSADLSIGDLILACKQITTADKALVALVHVALVRGSNAPALFGIPLRYTAGIDALVDLAKCVEMKATPLKGKHVFKVVFEFSVARLNKLKRTLAYAQHHQGPVRSVLDIVNNHLHKADGNSAKAQLSFNTPIPASAPTHASHPIYPGLVFPDTEVWDRLAMFISNAGFTEIAVGESRQSITTYLQPVLTPVGAHLNAFFSTPVVIRTSPIS